MSSEPCKTLADGRSAWKASADRQNALDRLRQLRPLLEAKDREIRLAQKELRKLRSEAEKWTLIAEKSDAQRHTITKLRATASGKSAQQANALQKKIDKTRALIDKLLDEKAGA